MNVCGACIVQYNYVQCVWIAVQAAAWLEFIVYVHVAIQCLAKLSVQLAMAPGRKKPTCTLRRCSIKKRK